MRQAATNSAWGLFGMCHLLGEHDPCIPSLPDVRAACCGHTGGGDYFMLTNGVIVRFRSGLRPDTIRRYVEIARKGDLHLLPIGVRAWLPKKEHA